MPIVILSPVANFMHHPLDHEITVSPGFGSFDFEKQHRAGFMKHNKITVDKVTKMINFILCPQFVINVVHHSMTLLSN